MKNIAILLLLILSLPFVLADWFYNSQNIITNVEISSEAEIAPAKPNGHVESVTVNLTFFPKQRGNQELLKLYTNPEAELEGDSLKFTWDEPKDKIDFYVNSNVKTYNSITKVKQKVKFPIAALPEDIVAYTKPSETIDSNDEDIIKIASELVKGEDDLYVAVFKIAEWTKSNINYNLSTLTAEVSQKASWVLQNKQGVCDELTSLFIALLRAVGIPARFISGLSYTESELFTEKWGTHGWAEVYFPGYGWVPFDVTYGELGWTDPTHIRFKEGVDSDEPSTYYNWLGRNADLKTNNLNIKGTTISRTGYFLTPLDIKTSPFKKSVSFGSYNLITADIFNPNDFYYANEIYLVKPQEVNVIGDKSKNILLLPREKKRVYWTLKLSENLDSRYSYTFPIIVSTINNITSTTNFTSSIRDEYVSFGEIEQMTKFLEEEKEKKYSGNVDLDCKSEKKEFYEYEKIGIYCSVRNIGNIYLENTDICFQDKCQKVSLGISQAKNVTFEVSKQNIGLIESPVTVRNELVSKTEQITLRIDDIPKIQIENLIFPFNVSYDKNFTINFTLSKKSKSNPKNVELSFVQNGIEKRWAFGDLEESRKFSLNFEGSQLLYGKNDYKINVDYYDGLNNEYNNNTEFLINLFNATLYERFSLWSNSIESTSLQTIFIMFFIALVAFIFVIEILFRKSKRL